MFDFLSSSTLPQTFGPVNVAFNLLLSLILCVLVALTYRHTHRGLSHSQSFTFTLILLGMLLSVIMMVIGNSIALAFGAFGAFSLIRFRTAIKDSKDIAFVLLVVSIGLAVGTNNHLIALLTTLVAILTIWVLTKLNFGSIRQYDYVLNFLTRTSLFSNEAMREVFKKYLKRNTLLNVIARENGQVLDYSLNITFKTAEEIEAFIKALSALGGVENVDVVSAKNDIEY